MTAPAVKVTMSTFDSGYDRPHYRCVREGVAIEGFVPVGTDEYMPSGGTPLRDATGKFIGHLDQLRAPGHVTIGLLLDESGSMGGNRSEVIEGVNQFVSGMRNVDEVNAEQDGTVLAVIVTDGHENSSNEVTAESLRQMIADREGNGWTFIFMGADIDAWAQGQAHGYSGGVHAHTVSYASTPTGTRSAFASLSGEAHSHLTSTPAEYQAANLGRSQRSITEDGQEVAANTNASPIAAAAASQHLHRPAYGDPSDALKAAKRATSKP